MSKQNSNSWIVAAVIGAAALFLLAVSFVGGGRTATPNPATNAAAPVVPGQHSAQPEQPQQPAAPAAPAPAAPAAGAPLQQPQGVQKVEGDIQTSPSGLQFIESVVGTGETPKAGQTVVVHYTGYLDNGTKFDSSLDRKQPFEFVLGAGQVIRGWDEGLASMKIGGKRRLLIPPQLGYGAQGAGGGVIPPNANLTFDVELMGVK